MQDKIYQLFDKTFKKFWRSPQNQWSTW
jgi:hypothetical protein